jgi:hypothetical protein
VGGTHANHVGATHYEDKEETHNIRMESINVMKRGKSNNTYLKGRLCAAFSAMCLGRLINHG